MQATNDGGPDDRSRRSESGSDKHGRGARIESVLEMALRTASVKAFAKGANGMPRLGVDVVDTALLGSQLNSSIGAHFRRRIYTDAEIVDCRDRVEKFATRWAIKEAVSKAIGTGFREGLHPSVIEVLTSPDGSITVAPVAGRSWPHSAEEWNWSVSAAHDAGVAVAVAIALA